MEQLALVITQPHQWGDLGELAGAVRRYVPVATIWIADDDGVRAWDGLQGAMALSPSPIADSRLSGAAGRAEGVDAEPELHSITSTTSIAAPEPEGFKIRTRNDDPMTASQRITREEIDMLLQMDSEVEEHRT